MSSHPTVRRSTGSTHRCRELESIARLELESMPRRELESIARLELESMAISLPDVCSAFETPDMTIAASDAPKTNLALALFAVRIVLS